MILKKNDINDIIHVVIQLTEKGGIDHVEYNGKSRPSGQKRFVWTSRLFF